jgi:4-hydroxybenzoate polyprenyltransferase
MSEAHDPLMAGAGAFSLSNFLNLGLGFIILCMLSSAGYAFNDALDVERDRRHPVK